MYYCIGVKEVWGGVRQWFKLQYKAEWKQWIQYLLDLKAPKAFKDCVYATFNTVVYNIWWARNQRIFHEKQHTQAYILNQVRDQMLQRILFLNRRFSKYNTCIDLLLG